MKTRTWPALAGCLFLLLSAACSDDSGGGGSGGTGGGGGTGGEGGTGGTGGGDPTGCAALELPGPVAEGAWTPGFTVAGFEGQDGFAPRVFDLALDPEGHLTATGYFSFVGEQPVPPLVRRKDGVWESARQEWELAPDPGGYTALAYGPAGELALATYAALAPFVTEIWVDGGEGLEVVGEVEGQVRTMVWFEDELWVAGNFGMTGGPGGLAVWNGRGWSAPPGGGPDGPVFELLPGEGTLLVGGYFGTIGGIAATSIAEWNGEAWTAHDFELVGTVYALARGQNGELYAGGPMFWDPEEGRGGIAVRTETGWDLLGNGVSSGFIPGVVSDLALFNGELYVTGCFSHVNGASSSPEAVPSRSVAKWNGMRWEALDPDTAGTFTAWYNPSACGDEGFDAVWNMGHQKFLEHEGLLYLAGSFPGVAGTASQALIATNGETWFPQGEVGDGLSGTVGDLAAGGPDCTLHAIGQISHAGGEPAPGRVLRYRDGWEAIGANRPAGLSCDAGLAVNDAGTVYVGCSEFPDEGDPRGRLFAIEGDDWVPQGEPHALGMIFDLALDPQGRPVIGGGGMTGYVARLEDGAFQVLADDFDSMVYRVAVAPGGAPDEASIVAGGLFTKVGEVPANRIARFDGATWSGLGGGLHAMPMAVEYGATGIYAATSFEGDPAREILARWDGTAWTELATPANGIPAPMGESVHTFTRLLERGGKLLATGYVWPESGGRNAFLWDGERFTAVGGGLPAISVDGVALAGDGLWFGGSIAVTGGERPIPSVGVARMTW